jgi:transposase
MRPYSVDLRVRVVQAVNDDNKPPEEVAQQFRISPASVYRFLQLNRDLNDLTPLKGTGRPRLIPTDLEPILLEQIKANNDLTLEEHCKLWKKRTGMKVSVTCMFESQKRADVTLKKSDHARQVRLMVKKRFKPVNETQFTAWLGSKPSGYWMRTASCSSMKRARTSV